MKTLKYEYPNFNKRTNDNLAYLPFGIKNIILGIATNSNLNNLPSSVEIIDIDVMEGFYGNLDNLPDNIHTIKFKNIAINTNIEEICNNIIHLPANLKHIKYTINYYDISIPSRLDRIFQKTKSITQILIKHNRNDVKINDEKTNNK